MSEQGLRIFNTQHGRDGAINFAVICNGHTHYVCRGNIEPRPHDDANRLCDGNKCRGKDSKELDASLLSSEGQKALRLKARVPKGFALITDRGYRKPYDDYDYSRWHYFESGALVTPKLLEVGVLLAEGEGSTYIENHYSSPHVYYLRNTGGAAQVKQLGKEGRRRTDKKLAKLRRNERKSEVSFDVSLLNTRLRELMGLYPTPEVAAEIENVKGLLRLASSLSLETSIEAMEGNEQIARELASSRAREIAIELQSTKEHLLLEKEARELAHVELEERG